MYKPRFLVTQQMYDSTTSIERAKYKYVVVPDEPVPLPSRISRFTGIENENTGKRTEEKSAR